MTDIEASEDVKLRFVGPVPLAVMGPLMEVLGRMWPGIVIESQTAWQNEIVFRIPATEVYEPIKVDIERPDLQDYDTSMDLIGFENGTIKVIPPERLMSEVLWPMAKAVLDHHEAPNYVEWTVSDKDDEIGPGVVITVQRKDGRTPHELRQLAEHQLAEIVSNREGLSS